MKKILLLIGLFLFAFSCEYDEFDFSPPSGDPPSHHTVKGMITEDASGEPLEGIKVSAHECKLCLFEPCDTEDYGDVLTAANGSFSLSYYGENEVRLYVTSPRVAVTDSTGGEFWHSVYTQYVLFGDTIETSRFQECHYDFDGKFFAIRMIKNPEL